MLVSKIKEDKILKSITKKLFLGFLTVLLFASCATTVPMATLEQDAFAKKFQEPADKSLIYLIRPSKLHAWGINIPILVDKLMVGNLSNGAYAVIEVPPGKHVISVVGTFAGDTILKINTEAGQIYFIKMSIDLGWSAGKINMELINEDEGKRLVKEYKLIETL